MGDANGRWDLALAHGQRQEGWLHWLLARDPDNFNYLDLWTRMHSLVGRLLVEHGNPDAARPHLAEAAKVAAKLSERDRANAAWRRWLSERRSGHEGGR